LELVKLVRDLYALQQKGKRGFFNDCDAATLETIEEALLDEKGHSQWRLPSPAGLPAYTKNRHKEFLLRWRFCPITT